MALYSYSSYTNDFFDLNGIYFNSSTGITTGLAPIESNSSLYLLKSGGTISSNLLINGSLDIKSTFTLETIGNVATAINEKQNLMNDDDLSISKTLNLQNSLDDLQDSINLKQNIINDGDLTISKILDLGIILAGKQDVTTNNTSSSDGPSLEPSSTTFNEIISSSIINNDKNIEDRDHFHYTHTGSVFSRGSGQALGWATVIRGSAIFGGEGFVPKYTGLYSISVAIYCAYTALGDTPLGLVLQFLYSNYSPHGINTNYILSCDASLNKESNLLHGTMVEDAIAGTSIRLAVGNGSCK
jgi:hypothetical protein